MRRFTIVLLSVCTLFIFACGSGSGNKKSEDVVVDGFPNVAGQYVIITGEFIWRCDDGSYDISTSKSENITVTQDGTKIDIIPEGYDQTGCVVTSGHIDKDGTFNYSLYCERDPALSAYGLNGIEYHSKGSFAGSKIYGDYIISYFYDDGINCTSETTYTGSKI